jgi:hypothetical protein
MKCRQAQDLMYLYRPGELTGRRRRQLEAHLASCLSCTAELKVALEIEKRVSEVRNGGPHLENASRLTDAIMRAIAESSQRPKTLLGILPEWTVTPAFRIAACVALFMICGTFFLQTAIDARAMAALEGRLKLQSTTSNAIGPREIQRAGLLLMDADRIPVLPDSLSVAVTPARKWRKEPAMSAVLQTLLGRQVQNGTTMIDYLAKRHPRLASVRIDDGFDDREREILASDGEAFLRDVESLIQKGGVHHDR